MEILELKNVITEIKIHCSDSNSSSRWQKKELVDNPEEGGLESRQLQPDLVSLVHCNPHSRSTSLRSHIKNAISNRSKKQGIRSHGAYQIT